MLHPSVKEQVALPLLARIRWLLAGGARPVLAINGPVGAGKTSLSQELQGLALGQGVRLGVASIDDFYLPWEQRQQAMAGNPFGVSRVPPGSHDPALLLECLRAWKAGGLWRRPRFDKALRQGQGDRSGSVEQACDALLLEGWLLGCRSLGLTGTEDPTPWRRGLEAATPALTGPELAWVPRWDRELQAYEPVWDQLDGIWVLRPEDWRWPRRWRFQAEARQRRRLRQEGECEGWLEAAELDALVRASLCSLPPLLYQEPLAHCRSAQVAGVATLDSRRRCQSG